MKGRITDDSWIIKRPIAHRGLHGGDIPENSKAAYLAAIEAGYPIEMDIQLTSDGEAVCFHDDNLKRMTGTDALVWDKTLAEVKSLKLGGTKEGIMTFEEFLSFVGGRVPLMIEIKTQKRYKELVSRAISLLNGYKGEYAVQSFDPRIMGEVRKLAPDIIRGQLITRERHETVSYPVFLILGYGLMNFISKPDFINMDLRFLPVSKRLRGKKRVICWTVRGEDDKEKAEKYAENYIFENMRI
ncbi:MAG: glycerophosphodiester phosphodiesterase [Clostridia bacterium]|nr:glycerophosphodiester phosphodiesterase [Clostridia bacterium]